MATKEDDESEGKSLAEISNPATTREDDEEMGDGDHDEGAATAAGTTAGTKRKHTNTLRSRSNVRKRSLPMASQRQSTNNQLERPPAAVASPALPSPAAPAMELIPANPPPGFFLQQQPNQQHFLHQHMTLLPRPLGVPQGDLAAPSTFAKHAAALVAAARTLSPPSVAAPVVPVPAITDPAGAMILPRPPAQLVEAVLNHKKKQGSQRQNSPKDSRTAAGEFANLTDVEILASVAKAAEKVTADHRASYGIPPKPVDQATNEKLTNKFRIKNRPKFPSGYNKKQVQPQGQKDDNDDDEMRQKQKNDGVNKKTTVFQKKRDADQLPPKKKQQTTSKEAATKKKQPSYKQLNANFLKYKPKDRSVITYLRRKGLHQAVQDLIQVLDQELAENEAANQQKMAMEEEEEDEPNRGDSDWDASGALTSNDATPALPDRAQDNQSPTLQDHGGESADGLPNRTTGIISEDDSETNQRQQPPAAMMTMMSRMMEEAVATANTTTTTKPDLATSGDHDGGAEEAVATANTTTTTTTPDLATSGDHDGRAEEAVATANTTTTPDLATSGDHDGGAQQQQQHIFIQVRPPTAATEEEATDALVF